EHVLERRPLRRGDQGDAPRKPWQRLLAVILKESLRVQLRTKLLERQFQRSLAQWLEPCHIELIPPALRVNLDAPGAEQIHPVLRLKLHACNVTLEHDAIDARIGVLHREVEMP